MQCHTYRWELENSDHLRECVLSHTPRRSSGSSSDHLRECVLSHICKQAHSDHQRECVHSHTLLRLGGISVSDHLRECVQCHTVASRPAQLRECVHSHTCLSQFMSFHWERQPSIEQEYVCKATQKGRQIMVIKL